MDFASRIYDRLFPRYKCLLILGASRDQPAWHWETWKRIVPSIDRLAGLLATEPSVRSRQVLRGKSSSPNLGRLSWSDEGHQRWCHDSPITRGLSPGWLFVDAEVFLPSRPSLIEHRTFPDVYINVSGVGGESDRLTAYDQTLLLAVRLPVFLRHTLLLQDVVRELQGPLNGVLNLSEVRRLVSLNQFESILLEDFTYLGMLEDALPDLKKLKGRWIEEHVVRNDVEQAHEAVDTRGV